MKNSILIITILLFVIGIGLYINYTQNMNIPEPNGENDRVGQVCFKGYCFRVEVAVSAEQRRRGLMFRERLDEDRGMLFIFQQEGNYPFWMKNTLIPLDIIWINNERVVVYINEHAQPCDPHSCPPINPNSKAKYVLELNAGKVNDIGLALGDQMSIEY